MVSNHHGRPRAGLDGAWKYRIEDGEPGETLGYTARTVDTSSWPTMTLPVNWYLTEVGDFFGTIWFSRTFAVPGTFREQRVFLRFGAVDYYADVWLNGRYLGSHEGMFNPFEFDVTDVLEYDGPNVLVVKDGAPRDETDYVLADRSDSPLSVPYRTHQARAISQIKGHMIDAMHRPGAQTSFRSDGNSGGIWDSVELVARPPVYVDDLKIVTRLVPDGSAVVAVDVDVHNTTGQVVASELRLEVAPSSFESTARYERIRSVMLQPGRGTHTVVLTVPEARLWWTWDLGSPDLYLATVTIAGDSVSERFGIKEVVRDEQTGQWRLNGRRIFLRGMRYISSQWMSEASDAMWSADLAMIRELEINAIRIGSHVEKDGFYRRCDELGLLVWQVFPLHYCVSDSDDLIERASEMIKDLGRMLRNHACLGMWSVFKEPEVYLLPDKPDNYHRLCPVLKDALASVDSSRWIHLGDYREGTLNLMIGYCWPGDTDLSRVTLEPNVVEFGAGSVPVIESLETFVPADKLWPPDWDTWEYYGFFYKLAFTFAKVSMADSLDEFVSRYQAYEALVIKEQIEFLRQRKYRPVASMFHYYWRDPCPIMGSGVLDYYRRPYQVLDTFRAVYGRVLVSLEREASPYVIGREKPYERGTSLQAAVWVTNDHPHELIDALVSWQIVHGDTEVLANSHVVTVSADSAEKVDHITWPIPPTAQPGTYRVRMRLADANGRTLSENHTNITLR